MIKPSQAILNEFNHDIAASLIEFGKSLAQIDADILVFMARKSLCLYDVLQRLGTAPPERPVVSDRILDMRLDPLHGKRIALVDDTLIVGTTLAKTKQRLEQECNASVQTHVFCVDKMWWCEDLIRPDYMSLLLDDVRVMTFCTSEVRALSLLPRPYLVDFPLSKPFRIPAEDHGRFLGMDEWHGNELSTGLQARNHVGTYTFFPAQKIIDELSAGFGHALTACLDIIKVRAFVRRHEDTYWAQIVPIVTLKPLSVADLGLLCQAIIETVSETARVDLDALLRAVQTPFAQQRLVQYCLSAALGERFSESTAGVLNHLSSSGYDLQEADRHYGPWFHDQMSTVTHSAFPALWSPSGIRHNPVHRLFTSRTIRTAALPNTVSSWANDLLRKAEAAENGDLTTVAEFSNDYSGASDNKTPRTLSEPLRAPVLTIAEIVTHFTEMFLTLYDMHELPARKEAKLLGKKLLDSTPLESRDRLNVGFPWTLIVEDLCHHHRLSPTRPLVELFSLVLDLLNDLGIAVPITCICDGVVYRAYRHGEDVKFADGELALCHDAIRGYLKSAGKDVVPKLVLEKLLVLLIKVGVSKGFLERYNGPGGVADVVKINFYLKGAIPVLSQDVNEHPRDNIWLSQHLARKGIIKLNGRGQYTLGVQPVGNYLTPTAPDDAYEMGSLLGMLWQTASNTTHKQAPLDGRALTILTACCSPRSIIDALRAELVAFRKWYRDYGDGSFRTIQWQNLASVQSCLQGLMRGQAHEALHAARMKYVAYRSHQFDAIVRESTQFLADGFSVDLLALRWKGYWTAISVDEAVVEAARFDRPAEKVALLCWELTACFSMIELVLKAAITSRNAKDIQRLNKVGTKLFQYSQALQEIGLPTPDRVERCLRFFQAQQNHQYAALNPQRVFEGAVEAIDSRMASISTYVEAITQILDTYGRIDGAHYYKYLVWYDTIDSTATAVARHKGDAEQHRKRVRQFKSSVNKQCLTLEILAKKHQTEMKCVHGDQESSNDEKHIFLSGTHARRYAEDVIKMLLDLADSLGVTIRVAGISCGFAGCAAYTLRSKTAVEGERFWEHWSRLQTQVKQMQISGGLTHSFLLLATDDLINNLRFSEGQSFIEPVEGNVTTEIEGLANTVPVRYGFVRG